MAHCEKLLFSDFFGKYYIWEGFSCYLRKLNSGGYVLYLYGSEHSLEGDSPMVIHLAYALLGLETADAVAAERERLAPIVRNEKDIPEILAYINGDRLNSEKLVADAIQDRQKAILKLEASESRNAKLVEALMKARSDRGSTYPQNNVWNICTNAIEAHKKGEVGA